VQYTLCVCLFVCIPSSFLTFFFPYTFFLTCLLPYSFTSWFSSNPVRQRLRSASSLDYIVPRTKTKFGILCVVSAWSWYIVAGRRPTQHCCIPCNWRIFIWKHCRRCELYCYSFCFFHWFVPGLFVSLAFTLLVGRQEVHSACVSLLYLFFQFLFQGNHTHPGVTRKSG